MIAVMRKQISKLQFGVVAACSVLFVVSLLSPPSPREQWLQHVPTVLALPALGIAAYKQWLSSGSLICLTALLALHIVGARWIYSYVPYDQWFERWIGAAPSSAFGWRRNHYDRLVHAAFGLLATPALVEAGVKYANLNYLAGVSFALLAILALSAAYEVFEWLLAITAAPDFADRYNGQQGDPWDAQKDMALAAAGSGVAAAAVFARRRLR